MVSHHVFYQLMLLGLLWLFLMLHGVWPSARPAQEQQTSQPITPPHKRSKEPKRVWLFCYNASNPGFPVSCFVLSSGFSSSDELQWWRNLGHL